MGRRLGTQGITVAAIAAMLGASVVAAPAAEANDWFWPRQKKVIYLTFDDGPSPYTQPVMNVLRRYNARATFFVEGAIGARLLSHTRVSNDRDLSTAFQFSDELRAGWTWGDQGRHTAGLRFQHLSNLGIKEPNPGINFWQLYYRYRF